MAKLYEVKDGDKLILDHIARLTIGDRQIEVETLFGEKKVFQGKVLQVDFLKSQIQLEED
jgi:predicted RNA-binding protein